MNDREKLIRLLGKVPCESDCEGSVGACPYRKYGECSEIYKLDMCELGAMADHLIANGVTVQQWIPVTERLPESEKRVLLLTECQGFKVGTYHDVMCGFYEDGNVFCEDSKCCWDSVMHRKELYDQERDDYRIPEGWYEEMLNEIDDYNTVAIGDRVTNWMPLPEPPKEDAP